MQQNERIYIAPKRGRLPRKYEVIDQLPVKTKLRYLALMLLVCAGFWASVWWIFQ